MQSSVLDGRAFREVVIILCAPMNSETFLKSQGFQTGHKKINVYPFLETFVRRNGPEIGSSRKVFGMCTVT